MRYFAFIFLISLILTGCIHVNVDEDRIFVPREKHPDSATTGMRIRYEESLTNKYIDVDHFTLPTQFGSLAMTHASKGGFVDRPLFLMCMGAHGERYRSGLIYIARAMKMGDVLIFDYPGYNDSDGEPSVADFQIAAARVSAYLEEQSEGTDRKILLWGHSLGGFVCSDVARQISNVDGIILETTAQNIEDVVDARTPKLIKPFLRTHIHASLTQYDIAKSLESFTGPILVLGAGQDEVLDVELSRTLAAQLKTQGANVTYLEFPNATHTNVPYRASLVPSIETLFLED